VRQRVKARIASVSVDTGDWMLTFAFTHGASINVRLADLSPEVRNRLALHGLEQKLRDAYAGVSDPEQAYGLARKVLDALRAGQWTVRGSSEPRPDSMEVLSQAVVAAAAAAGRTLEPEAVKAKLKTLDRSALSKLRSDPRVAAELARLRGKSQNVLEDLF
jgi:hypothetical protein